MTRRTWLLSGVIPLTLLAQGAQAQDLNDRAVAPPPVDRTTVPASDDEVQFTAESLVYDSNADVVTASGDVRMFRQGERLRADTVTWDRKSGKVVARGNIAVTNPQGDTAYGDSIELSDTLRDGIVQNLLVVLDDGSRLAAARGERFDDGSIRVDMAAYTACAVTTSEGCPKEPSWKITAVKVSYSPALGRIRYTGARFSLFGVASIPLPAFSHPVGGKADSGLLAPSFRLDRVNGFEVALPYYVNLGPNRDLTLTPHVYTDSLPLLQGEYRELNSLGAFRVTAYGTYGRRSDDQLSGVTADSKVSFRGYIDAAGRYQLSPEWSVSGSLRLSSDQTFQRRYDISNEDRLRNNIAVERIDRNSYLAINGWFVQTLRVGERQGLQAVALPEIDYRRLFDDGLTGGRFQLQLNTLALTRDEGQDTQRAFAGLRWDLRRLTAWGQEVTLTAYARGDIYHTDNTAATTVVSYRGEEGVRARAIGALAIDVKWPFVGEFLGGTQRITPRIQIVAAPRLSNFAIPNEDARAVDLEDSNLFALNRFAGYDRFEDSTRFTYGIEYALDLPQLTVNAVVGQSYRLTTRSALFPDGTGLTDRMSDIVGRTEVRYRDFISVIHRYRVDKDGLAVRRNELDTTIGSRSTYVMFGYLRLNRNIGAALEDLQDREEARVGARIKFAKFWSVFASATIDLTDRSEDVLSLSDGFDPVRHRLGIAYEDDCLKLGVTWKRDYEDAGDARRGSSYLLTLSFKNLGR